MTSDEAEWLLLTASHCRARPSVMLGIQDPRVAYALDEALTARHGQMLKAAAERAEEERRTRSLPGRQLPKGMRYATEADLERW